MPFLWTNQTETILGRDLAQPIDHNNYALLARLRAASKARRIRQGILHFLMMAGIGIAVILLWLIIFDLGRMAGIL